MIAPWPESVGIAFKEWQGVCSALAVGKQALILRKGGIEEGLSGFEPEHPFFWLYPTVVHQAEQGLKPGFAPATSLATSGHVDIQSLVAIEWVERIDKLETLLGLDPFHAWTEETVTKRFYYRKPGVWLLAARVFNLPEPVAIPITPEQLGCKTWVPLDAALLTTGLKPAIPESEFRGNLRRIRDVLDSPGRGESL